MSATNQTSTIGLSQYISTDKPTYLVDYNSDMLKIDNAIAADRGSIADVNTVAERAEGKADTNKSSIDTLNEQVNGDPEVPSDTGIAGKVSALEGNVNTINSLIGNGTPTTSDQTLIGAVNALEGAVAPREDGADLANSYAIGEQFARGGSVYTALTALTAGTAFASLTLNTDYKVSDPLTSQLSNIVNDIEDIKAVKIEEMSSVSVNSDGVKTYSQLLDDLYAELVTASEGKTIKVEYINTPNGGFPYVYPNVRTGAPTTAQFIGMNANLTDTYSYRAVASGSTYKSGDLSAGTVSDRSDIVPNVGVTLTIVFATYSFAL